MVEEAARAVIQGADMVEVRFDRLYLTKPQATVVEDEDGNVIKRLLQLCQPLSWSMESTNSSLGGFNETIDIAVQKISKF